MLPFWRYDRNNLTLNRILGLKEHDSITSHYSARKREKIQGQRSAPFFLRAIYGECIILIHFKELTIQELNRLTFDLQIETGGKMDVGCEGGMGGGVAERKTGIS